MPRFLPLRRMKSSLLLTLALALLLSGCGEPPLSALINVQAKYPGAEVQMINQIGEVNLAVTRWIVKTETGLFVVWCSDEGKVVAEQSIHFSQTVQKPNVDPLDKVLETFDATDAPFKYATVTIKTPSPLCKCGKPCQYYGDQGGWSGKCKGCNAKNATRQRAARKKAKEKRGK